MIYKQFIKILRELPHTHPDIYYESFIIHSYIRHEPYLAISQLLVFASFQGFFEFLFQKWLLSLRLGVRRSTGSQNQR